MSLGLTAYTFSKLSQRGDHNEHKFEIGRLLSFKNWPSGSISASPTRLARAGLYYFGKAEEVRCYSCNVVIKDREIGDNPFKKHSAQCPLCLHVLGTDENNVPITAPTIDRATPYLHHAFPEAEVSPVVPNQLYSGLTSEGLDMKNEIMRLGTFNGFPDTCPVRPADLARAGFFYVNVDDMVKCAFCNGMFRNWERGDRAFDKHARHFPRCTFVNFNLKLDACRNPNFDQSNNVASLEGSDVDARSASDLDKDVDCSPEGAPSVTEVSGDFCREPPNSHDGSPRPINTPSGFQCFGDFKVDSHVSVDNPGNTSNVTNTGDSSHRDTPDSSNETDSVQADSSCSPLLSQTFHYPLSVQTPRFSPNAQTQDELTLESHPCTDSLFCMNILDTLNHFLGRVGVSIRGLHSEN